MNMLKKLLLKMSMSPTGVIRSSQNVDALDHIPNAIVDIHTTTIIIMLSKMYLYL